MITKNYLHMNLKVTPRWIIAVLILFGVGIFNGIALATPPEPPVNLIQPSAKTLENLKQVGKYISVPFNFRQQPEINKVRIEVIVLDMQGIGVKKVAGHKQSVNSRITNRQTNIVVNIPVIPTPGIYRVEITAANGEAVYDRESLYQIVTKNTVKLYTPANWRKLQTEQRKKEFEREATNTGRTPSVALLDPSLIKVPDAIVRKAKPLPMLANSVIVDPVQGIGEDEKPYVIDESETRWRKHDPVSIEARIFYEDFEGTVRPLVNATIRIYDDELVGSSYLGSTITDSDGKFSFSVNNDDGWLQNGRDLFFKVVATNSRFEVKDSWGTEYRWKSDTVEDMNEGDNHDFGSLEVDSDEEAAQIFSFLNIGWSHITTVGGRDPGYYQARYPTTNSGDNFSGGKLRITASSNRAPDIVLHEYGHALMDAAYPGGDPSPGGSHNFGETTQDERLAWSEGWATAFMLSVCPDNQYNWDEGTSESTGEWPDCTVQNDTGGQEIEKYSNSTNRQGELQEARVAAALLDFFDSNDDNNGSNQNLGRNDYSDANTGNEVSLEVIYNDIMWGSGHNDFLDFWDSLIGELTGTAEGPQAANIMLYNWMSEPTDISNVCVSSKVAASELGKQRTNALKGLRLFRDEGLKPLVDGRHLIQSYYRHSPEMAMLLLKNPKARTSAAQIIKHFAKLGYTAKSQKQLKQIASTPMVPKNIRRHINQIFRLIKRSGSKELIQDARNARKFYSQIARLTVVDALTFMEKLPKVTRDTTAISPKAWAPRSRKADWRAIHKAMDYVNDIPLLKNN